MQGPRGERKLDERESGWMSPMKNPSGGYFSSYSEVD
jgi:hypothetical protein